MDATREPRFLEGAAISRHRKLSALDSAIGRSMAQCEMKAKGREQRSPQPAKAQVDPNLPVVEIGWAWAKAASELSSDKLLDALIEAMCNTVLGDAVFTFQDGEFLGWTSPDIRATARRTFFRGNPAYRAAYLEGWRLRRCDFAQWYNRSYLSAGAPLDSFWPGSEPAASKTRGERRRPTQVKRDAVRRACAKVYGKVVPDQATVSNNVLATAITKQLVDDGNRHQHLQNQHRHDPAGCRPQEVIGKAGQARHRRHAFVAACTARDCLLCNLPLLQRRELPPWKPPRRRRP